MDKSHKSAVVLIPPELVWPQIQKIRKKYDKAYHRWMPHINLIYPFLEYSPSAFKEAQSKFEDVLQSIEPFKVAFTFDSFGSFIHGKNATVWLKPVIKQMINSEVPKQARAQSCQHKVHGSSPNTPITGYQPPYVMEAKHIETGLEALKDAVWSPETNCTSDKVTQVPSIDNLRFAFIGVDGFDGEFRKEDCDELDVSINEEDDTVSFGFFKNEDLSFYDFAEKSFDANQVHSVQSILQSVYPEFDDLAAKDAFQPHLTLGQCPAHKVDKFIQGLQDFWKDVEFEVDEVCLIHREGNDAPFEVDHRIKLDKTNIDQDIISTTITEYNNPNLAPGTQEISFESDLVTGLPLMEDPEPDNALEASRSLVGGNGDNSPQFKGHQPTYDVPETMELSFESVTFSGLQLVQDYGKGTKVYRPKYRVTYPTSKQKAPDVRSKSEFPALSTGTPRAPAGFEPVVLKKKKNKKK